MVSILSIILLLLIIVTLRVFNKDTTNTSNTLITERFNQDVDTLLDNINDRTNLITRPIRNLENVDRVSIQNNQKLIFNKFFKKVNDNSGQLAKVFLKKKINDKMDKIEYIYDLNYFQTEIDSLETKLIDIENSKNNELCGEFDTNYCSTNKKNDELFTEEPIEFKKKLDICYPICQRNTIDRNLIINFRKTLYDPLFDILLRYDVLKKINGDTEDPIFDLYYEKLIKTHTGDIEPDIDINMDGFYKTNIKHLDLIKEFYSFINIINLNINLIENINRNYKLQNEKIYYYYKFNYYRDKTSV